MMRDTDWRAEMRPVTRREETHTHTHSLTHFKHTGQNILVMHRFINACRNTRITSKMFRNSFYINEKLYIDC